MVTDYHKNIQNSLISYGEVLKKTRKIRRVHEGNKRPLSIVDPRTKFVVNYQPDVYYILKNNKKLIFEILASEEKKQDIIIADIIRTMLVENVEALIFIHPGDSKCETMVLEALKTMYKGLTDLGISLSRLPNSKKTGPYSITMEEAKTKESIFIKLDKYLKFWITDFRCKSYPSSISESRMVYVENVNYCQGYALFLNIVVPKHTSGLSMDTAGQLTILVIITTIIVLIDAMSDGKY